MKYLTQVVYTYTICEIILPRRFDRRGKILFYLNAYGNDSPNSFQFGSARLPCSCYLNSLRALALLLVIIWRMRFMSNLV